MNILNIFIFNINQVHWEPEICLIASIFEIIISIETIIAISDPERFFIQALGPIYLRNK